MMNTQTLQLAAEGEISGPTRLEAEASRLAKAFGVPPKRVLFRFHLGTWTVIVTRGPSTKLHGLSSYVQRRKATGATPAQAVDVAITAERVRHAL